MNIGPTILAASLTLALLVLPIVVIAAREAIRAVPDSLRQAAYGLGASKWQTVSRVVLPYAAPGIATGILLAVARAIGETAPLLLVGAAAFVPFDPYGPLSEYTVLPVQIYSWISENDPEFKNVAAAAILVLLVILIAFNWLILQVRRRFARK
jgi:phosphate transport system permease protein